MKPPHQIYVVEGFYTVSPLFEGYCFFLFLPYTHYTENPAKKQYYRATFNFKVSFRNT